VTHTSGLVLAAPYREAMKDERAPLGRAFRERRRERPRLFYGWQSGGSPTHGFLNPEFGWQPQRMARNATALTIVTLHEAAHSTRLRVLGNATTP